MSTSICTDTRRIVERSASMYRAVSNTMCDGKQCIMRTSHKIAGVTYGKVYVNKTRKVLWSYQELQSRRCDGAWPCEHQWITGRAPNVRRAEHQKAQKIRRSQPRWCAMLGAFAPPEATSSQLPAAGQQRRAPSGSLAGGQAKADEGSEISASTQPSGRQDRLVTLLFFAATVGTLCRLHAQSSCRSIYATPAQGGSRTRTRTRSLACV